MNRWAPLIGLVLALSAAAAFLSIDDAFSAIDGLGTAILAAYGALGVGCIAWGRRNRGRALVAVIPIVGALVWMVVATMAIGGEYGLSAPMVLQEGTFESVVAATYAHGGHAWPVFQSWVRGASSANVPIEGLMASNVGAGWMAGALFFTIVWQLTGRWVTAAVFLALFVGNADMRAAMLSETAAPMSWGFMAALLVGWSVARRQGATSTEIVVGAVVVTSASVMLSGTRPELGLFGLGALLAWTVDAWFGPVLREYASALWRQLRAGDRRAWIAVGGVFAAAAFSSIYVLGLELTENMYLRWAIRGVVPLNPAILDLPAVAVAWLPVGVVTLAVVGIGIGLLKPLKYGLFAVALIVCFRAWESAGHRCYPEMIRYMTFLTPAILLAAAVGIREISDRVSDERRRDHVVWILTACALTPILPGAHSFYEPDDATTWRYLNWGEAGGLSSVHPLALPAFNDVLSSPRELLTYDQQAAAQIVRRVARSSCMVVTRVADGQFGVRDAERDRLILTQNGVVKQRWQPSEGTAGAVMAHLEAGGFCARYLRGLDCDLAPGNRCDGDLLGLRRAGDACPISARPYNDVREYGQRIGSRAIALFGLGDLPDFSCADQLSSSRAAAAVIEAAQNREPTIDPRLRIRLDAVISRGSADK